MNDSDRIALLAGAGLSVDAGLPTAVELADRLRECLLDLTQTSEGSAAAIDKREQAKQWLALYNFLDGGIRFQEGVLNRNPDARVNIEQIAIAAEELQARMTNPLAAYSAGWHRRLEELERGDAGLLKNFVEFTYSRLQEWLLLGDPKRVSYLRGLGELINDDIGLDIFTLNYDLCVEEALSAADLRFSNGFNTEGVWSPTALDKTAKIRLYKLHGSLDWVDDEVYGLCSLQFPRHENAETIQGDELRPLLIFGTLHKLSAREPFLTLAYHFSQAVLRTRALAVVGYSFGDDHVNQIIEQGLKKNSGLRIVVVSPAAEDLVRQHRFLDRNPRVSTIPTIAKTALNERIVADKIREILKDVKTEAPFP
jgi:hypothetical protein